MKLRNPQPTEKVILQILTLLFNTGPRMRKLYTCIHGNKIIAMLFYIVLQPPGITNTANNCYASSVLQCLMNHPVFLQFLQSTSKHTGCECTKLCINIYCKFKV